MWTRARGKNINRGVKEIANRREIVNKNQRLTNKRKRKENQLVFNPIKQTKLKIKAFLILVLQSKRYRIQLLKKRRF